MPANLLCVRIDHSNILTFMMRHRFSYSFTFGFGFKSGICLLIALVPGQRGKLTHNHKFNAHTSHALEDIWPKY